MDNAVGNNDPIFAEKVVSEFFRLFFTPEFERRRDAGLLGADFQLQMAQAILPENGAATIRFNEEIRGRLNVHVSRDVKPDEGLSWTDVDGLRGFELEDEELDYGHATIVRRAAGGWFAAFNFLRGRNKAAALINKAEQFKSAGAHSLGLNHSAVAADTLFSACELLGKAYLIITMMAQGKQHAGIHSKINYANKLGNVDPEFTKLFNYLSNVRASARYEAQEVPIVIPAGALAAIEMQTRRLKLMCKIPVE